MPEGRCFGDIRDSHYIHERREIVCMSWHISFLSLLSLSSWLLSLSLLPFQLHLFSCMSWWLHDCGSPWKSYHYGSDVDRTLQLAPTVRYFSVEIFKSADLPPFWAQNLIYSRILSSMTNQTAAAGMGEAPLHTHRFKLFHALFFFSFFGYSVFRMHFKTFLDTFVCKSPKGPSGVSG